MGWSKEDKLTKAAFVGEKTADILTDGDETRALATQRYGMFIDTAKMYCFSVHIEKTVEARYSVIQMYYFQVAPEINNLMINTKTGEVNNATGPTVPFGSIDLGTHWRVYIAAQAVNPSNVYLTLSIIPAAGVTFNSDYPYDYWITGSLNVSKAQLNEGTVPHTYVKTTTEVVDGTIQNLLLWSEQFEKWTGPGDMQIGIDEARAPTDELMWPNEAVLPHTETE